MPPEMKRMPAVEKTIADIKETDIRVKLYGSVIETAEDSILLDDGTGQVKVATENLKIPSQNVMVVGKVIAFESGVEIKGEIISDATGLDRGLLEKVRVLEAGKG